MNNQIKVLITGGAGFIGYHLAKKLSDNPNYQIVIADNFSRGRMDTELCVLQERENVSIVNGDITCDQFYLSVGLDFDYVYHLAAVIGVRNVTEHPDIVLQVNAISTLKLFNHFKESKRLRKIFFSSTSEIYAGTLHHFGMAIPTPEDTPLTLLDIASPRTTYMLSKMYGESICHNYNSVYSIPCTIGRFHNVYGPRMGFQHVIPEMFVKINSSESVDVASPGHTRSYCYVEDAVTMSIMVTEHSDSKCEVYNIGVQGPEIKVTELVGLIAKTMGVNVNIVEKYDIDGSPRRRCPEMNKLTKLTGYVGQFDLATGLKRTYEWYRNHLNDVYE